MRSLNVKRKNMNKHAIKYNYIVNATNAALLDVSSFNISPCSDAI